MAWRKFPSFNLFFINFFCLSFSDVFRPFPAIFLPFPGYPFPLADKKKIYPTLLRSFGYIWWTGVDSDHRSQVTTDLQSVPFGRSGTCPYYGAGDWNRTHNLLITNQLLCQLSYTSEKIKKNGALGRNRTTDRGIFSPLLYRLSYQGKIPFRGIKNGDLDGVRTHDL